MRYGPDLDANLPQPMDHKHCIVRHNLKLDALLESYIDDESDGDDKDATGWNQDSHSKHGGDPAHPWLQGFHNYLNIQEHLGNTTIVQWWRMHFTWHPVWR